MSMLRFLPLIFFLAASIPLLAASQDGRSYLYDAIHAVYHVRNDSTVGVTETLTYDFAGEYHQGWRTLSHRGVDRISNVRVFDGATGEALRYSGDELEKTDPTSWGAYTVTRSPGATNVIWYYDAKDEKRSWVITYTLHGAVAFYKDHDELYWNVVADYDVPVREATAEVRVEGAESGIVYRASDYGSDGVTRAPTGFIGTSAYFSARNIPPGGAYTIALGWPKGLVDKNAYYLDALRTFGGYLLALLIAAGSIIYAIAYWWTKEGRMRGRGTIVPQYEPPERLKPAMAEYIVHERLSPKTWAATIVDLAVRGYVAIEEDTRQYLFGLVTSREYLVRKARSSDGGMEEYEKDFLDALFMSGDGSTFSTRAMKRRPSNAQKLYGWMKEVEKKLLAELTQDTGAYEVPPASEVPVKYVAMGAATAVKFIRVIGVILVSGSVAVGLPLLGAVSGGTLWIVGAMVFGAILVYIVRHDARLNLRGRILREDWLGFKMYLETAERLRLQNLTPETFERFLPYAMIFGIEKKWAKAFEGISMPPPNWYHGNAAAFAATGSSGSSGGFSPSGFASGFSSSFSTAFSSSGGGGASGGGGGAGGGGGGGGGGAS